MYHRYGRDRPTANQSGEIPIARGAVAEVRESIWLKADGLYPTKVQLLDRRCAFEKLRECFGEHFGRGGMADKAIHQKFGV